MSPARSGSPWEGMSEMENSAVAGAAGFRVGATGGRPASASGSGWPMVGGVWAPSSGSRGARSSSASTALTTVVTAVGSASLGSTPCWSARSEGPEESSVAEAKAAIASGVSASICPVGVDASVGLGEPLGSSLANADGSGGSGLIGLTGLTGLILPAGTGRSSKGPSTSAATSTLTTGSTAVSSLDGPSNRSWGTTSGGGRTDRSGLRGTSKGRSTTSVPCGGVGSSSEKNSSAVA